MPDCPVCGHKVKAVGDTTQHYEPVGCFQLEDDHEVCDRQLRDLKREVNRLRRERDLLAQQRRLVIDKIGRDEYLGIVGTP